MRPNQSGSRDGIEEEEGGKKFVHFPFPRFSPSFSLHPPYFDELSDIVVAEGAPSQAISSLSLSLRPTSGTNQVRWEKEESERANASAQVSCPNTLRPDRRLVGTHSERAS